MNGALGHDLGSGPHPRKAGVAGGRSPVAAALAAALVAGLLATVAGASPARAVAGTSAAATVYLSHSGAASTDLKTAALSRTANGGAGGVALTTLGAGAATYNAIGYRVADDRIYAVANNRLIRVAADGSTSDLGPVAGLPAGNYAAGSFGGGSSADTLFVLNGGSTMFAIDPGTLAATPVPLTQAVSPADITWAQGYLWGVSIEAGFPKLVRVATDGTVTALDTTGVINQVETGSYSAAWTYGNGNLAFRYGPTGAVTQVKVSDVGGPSPTLSRVTQVLGAASGTSTSDGTTTPAAPADLGLAVAPPVAARPGDAATWRVTVSASGPGVSSGGTFGFAVPSGVTLTSAGLPVGCSALGSNVQCVSGQLAPGASDTYEFTGTLNSALTVPQSTVVALAGNELDPTPTNDAATLTVRPSSQDRTSTGSAGGTQSTTVAKSRDASVFLLDDEARVSSVAVAGQGTYTVTTSSGVVTFQPVAGFVGQARTVGFVIVPASGETATGSYTATVAPPPGPSATPQRTVGVGAAPQATGVLRPAGGSLVLLDGSPAGVPSLVGVSGTYLVEGDRLVFSPRHGWSGTADPVGYRVTDGHGQAATSTYTVTVTRPAALVVTDLASTGRQGRAQGVRAGGEAGSLIDAAGLRSQDLVVPGQGRYVAGMSEDGVALRFEPEPCFVGAAKPVGYVTLDAWGSESNIATYRATVTGDPVAVDVTSAGVGTAVQAVVPSAPCGESVRLLDEAGQPVTSLTRAGEGTFAADPGTGRLSFTPLLGYAGTPAAAPYRVTAGDGAVASALYTVTVAAPAPPAPPARTSTGVGPAVQAVQLPGPPSGGSVALVDLTGEPVTTVSMAAVGSWMLDPVTRVLSYVPAPGFLGTAPHLRYRVTDAYAQSATATYTATVTRPAPPPTTSATSSGPIGATQLHRVVVPDGGSVTLLDEEDQRRTVVRVPDVGSYHLESATGVIAFTPRPRFTGRASPVAYLLADSYGQSAVGSFRARVTLAAPVPASQVGVPRVDAPRLVRGVRTVPTGCALSIGRVAACTVTAYARVDGRRVEVGRGRRASSDPPRRLAVPVRLGELGRALARRPGGVRVQLRAAVRRAGVDATRSAVAATRVQARRVELRPVYFASNRARVRPAGRAYLAGLRSRLGGLRAVRCVGFTDARASVAHNRRLAQRRARAACVSLLGKRSAETVIIARGETRPSHSNATGPGRARNRRAEIVLRY